MDLAKAFLAHITTPEFADLWATNLEYAGRGEGDDEFAAIHGLV